MATKSYDAIDAETATILAELVIDEKTTEHIRIQILNKLLQEKEDQSFFDTMLEEQLDFGECPYCNHKNNWLVPEEEKNQRGLVTCKEDPRVSSSTDYSSCSEFQEACAKKKVTI